LFTIHLHNCRFFAHHGLFKEEAVVGAAFELNLSAGFEEEGLIVSMNETLNYVALYDIVKKHFDQPRKLLETLAQEIAAEIQQFDNRVKTIEIHIKKLNPPIANFTGSVGVSFTKQF
jgi:7,8-dihydroneopterin aldolase/epimerase/oxygenase